MNKLFLGLIFLTFLFSSCNSIDSLQVDTSKFEVIKIIGKPDSIQISPAIQDVYTNKLINIEKWFYGTDTIIIFANNKIQNLTIQPK